VDLKLVKTAIVDLIEKDSELRNDGTALYGTMIRLAWHAAGTYSCTEQNGGSNGALQRFEPECSWGANAGLGLARDKLESIKQQFPDLSYADLYTYAGVVAVEATGGPTIPFRIGRTDAGTFCSTGLRFCYYTRVCFFFLSNRKGFRIVKK
jgi:cytochrome c peroxidase